jgi:hypothetical protein
MVTSRKVRCPKKSVECRLVITDFDEATGQPREPLARAFVNHLGYLVWDRLPINAREWKKNKQHPEISYVSDHDTEQVSGDVL